MYVKNPYEFWECQQYSFDEAICGSLSFLFEKINVAYTYIYFPKTLVIFLKI